LLSSAFFIRKDLKDRKVKEYNNPKDVKNIVNLCDKHFEVDGNIENVWERVVLIGIRRFASSYMFIVWNQYHELYIQKIRF